jgi:RTX calcium-binding nonapeptide repeat (4 copies)
MVEVGFPRGSRVVLGALAVAVCAAAIVPAALGRAGAPSARERLAARVMRLDPGARIGGNTQVATAPGARLVGVPHRVNFMVALGPRERLVGGARADQLGAHGAAGARIHGAGGDDLIHGGHWGRHGVGGGQLLAGGPGGDLIYGEAGRDRLRGGPGNDRLIDGRGATTARPGPGANVVDVADGQGDDRVLCVARAHDRIRADRGDRVGPACDRQPSRVRRGAPSGPRAQAAAVTGDGSNDHPFTAPVDDPTAVDSAVSSFASRSLSGWLSNEYVPAYKCPDLAGSPPHPLLLDQGYAPFGTDLPEGVEVQGLGPIGVSITGINVSPDDRLSIGTLTGFSNSSATNWKGGTQSYQVVLHCTNDRSHGWSPD